MKAKRKKSMADISAQFGRLFNAAGTLARQKTLQKIERAYRYAILGHFRASYGFTDRMYYKPLTRRVYAGY